MNTFPGVMALMPAGEYRPLFNGNISSMAIYNRSLNGTGNVGGPLMLYNYHYDQLNRLTSMDAYNKTNFTGNNWLGFNGMNQFKERVVYDGNGNILKYRRHGHKSDLYIMDSLTYTYYDQTNRLNWVKDITPSSRYGNDPGDVPDIDNQALNNYQYDEIGNLTKDVKEGITSIKWSVYGKILEINRASTAANPVQKITYTYDAQGNRISKAVLKNTGTTSYTWYARDAQGNVMATYSSSGGASDLSQLPLNLSEQHIYGSSRLGMYAKLLSVDNGPKDMADSNSIKYYRGYRQYELSNHLGNVLATISDKKKGVDTDSDGIIDYYDADVTTAQDYYPFGMLMPGRIGYLSGTGWTNEPGSSVPPDNSLPADISFIEPRVNNLPPEYVATNSIEFNAGFESGSGDAFLAYISEDDGSGGGGGEGSSSLNGVYRYGFNGKENDNEVKGIGNQQDYGMRIYDPRLGRFLSLDPISSDYPFYTPYQFAGNKPIIAADLDGAEEWMKTQQLLLERQAKLQVANMNKPRQVTVSSYNPNDRTFAQKWRDSKNIVAQITYGAANGLYTLPQQLTANLRGADYIENIGGNLHEARGVFGEKQRVSNFINGATFFVPGAQEGQAFKGLAFADDLMRLGIRNSDDAVRYFGGSFDNFVESATKMDRNGLTMVGRALQKHAGREGSSFADIKFSGKTGNQQGLDVLNDILNSADQLIDEAENGTKTIFDKLTGRGVNVSRSGEFNGFRDLKELKK